MNKLTKAQEKRFDEKLSTQRKELIKNIKSKMGDKAYTVPISEGCAVVKWKDIEDILKLFEKLK